MAKLTKAYKEKLKDQIKVKLRKNPNSNLAEMKEFILEGDPTVFDYVNRNQLNSFLNYNMEKFSQTGTLDRTAGSGRPSKLTQQKKDDIVATCKEKRFTGTTRKAVAQCDVSQTTVIRVLKEAGLKSYSAKPVQKLNGRQQMSRLVSSHDFLNTYGMDVSRQSTWGRLVNTDFSAGIKLTGSVNPRHDRVWAQSEDQAGALVDFAMDKHDISYMVIVWTFLLTLCLQSLINVGVGWYQCWGSDPKGCSIVCLWDEGGICCPRRTTWSQRGSHRYTLKIALILVNFNSWFSRWLLCLDGQDQGCPGCGGSVPGRGCHLAGWPRQHTSHKKCPCCLFCICWEDSTRSTGRKVLRHLANWAGIWLHW